MEDQEIKQFLSTTKLKAEDKLKARIIHQINAEKALISAKQLSTSTTLENHFSIFGIMYIILLSLIGYFYFKTDGNPLQSTSFLVSSIFTASMFSVYWSLIVYSDYKKSKG